MVACIGVFDISIFGRRKGPGTLKGVVKLWINYHFLVLHIVCFCCFLTRKYPFFGQPGPGMTPGWGIKVPNTSIIIAWGVFWPIIQFPGWFFRSIWHPVILTVFYPQNHPFSDPPGPGMTPGWGIKVSNTSIPIAWGVFWPIFQFPDGLLVWYGSLPSWSILTQKRAIFGRPLTWNGTWRGAKWPQTTFPYV